MAGIIEVIRSKQLLLNLRISFSALDGNQAKQWHNSDVVVPYIFGQCLKITSL